MAVSNQPIVVGVDGSERSFAAASWAAAAARRCHTVLHLVIAGDPARIDYAEETVCEFAARCRRGEPGLEVTEEVVSDHPVDALVHSSAEAQMVVVGSRGHGAFLSSLLGGVSASVAARSSCPVVIVRTGKKRRSSRSPEAAVGTGAPREHASGTRYRCLWDDSAPDGSLPDHPGGKRGYDKTSDDREEELACKLDHRHAGDPGNRNE